MGLSLPEFSASYLSIRLIFLQSSRPGQLPPALFPEPVPRSNMAKRSASVDNGVRKSPRMKQPQFSLEK